MTWKRLAADDRVEPHVTTKQELDDLRGAVGRNLQDAALHGLSVDNKFGLAYEAVLLLAKMAIACAGYRTKGRGGHHTTFVALKLAMGPGVSKMADYFDRCRRKRNDLSYDSAGIVSATEAEELMKQSKAFRTTVETWIIKNHPKLAP